MPNADSEVSATFPLSLDDQDFYIKVSRSTKAPSNSYFGYYGIQIDYN
jgi:hypothetical protein